MKCDHDALPLFQFCAQCGEAKSPTADVDYFGFFGLTPAFFVDENKIQKEFYSLSKTLHPDRFHQKSPEQLIVATQNFARVNKALTTLKSPIERAQYLFEMAHFTPHAVKGSLPPDLAEEYFELQESLEDQAFPVEKKASLIKTFSQAIQEKITEADSRRDLAFKDWESNGHPLDVRAKPFFERAAREMNQRSYLSSMAADLEKRFPKEGFNK